MHCTSKQCVGRLPWNRDCCTPGCRAGMENIKKSDIEVIKIPRTIILKMMKKKKRKNNFQYRTTSINNAINFKMNKNECDYYFLYLTRRINLHHFISDLHQSLSNVFRQSSVFSHVLMRSAFFLHSSSPGLSRACWLASWRSTTVLNFFSSRSCEKSVKYINELNILLPGPSLPSETTLCLDDLWQVSL